MGDTAAFCDEVWARAGKLVRAIHEHPFNAELGAGTLDRDRFAFYIVQDARYLVAFAKALATASTRATDPDEAAFFAQSAHTALVVERSLHSGYVEEFGLTADIEGIPTSPTCVGYSSYLQATALAEPYPVLVAALLPCFWVYQDVGAALLERTAPTIDTHPYRAWISTYSDPDFAASVDRVKAIADRLAAAEPASRAAMTDAFLRATEYEWLFWDSAWRRETWPTAQWLA